VVGGSGGISGNGGLALIMNNGDGTFGNAVNLPLGGPLLAGALTSWDMDGDLDFDLVTIVNDVDNQLGPVIRILRNDSSTGQVAFTLMKPIGVGEEPRLVQKADVTGDLAEDLIAVNVVSSPLASPGSASSSLAIRPNISGTVQVPGDITGNGIVNIDDLLAVINSWGPCPNPNNCPADVFPPPGGDDVVNIDDLLFVINNWG
jgi:hypothetical protein